MAKNVDTHTHTQISTGVIKDSHTHRSHADHKETLSVM